MDNGGTITRNAIHLGTNATHAYFYDLAGKQSTDNDGISGAGNIVKEGAGDLRLYGVYANHTGTVDINGGNVLFTGNQTFGGDIDVAAGAGISLADTTRSANAVVSANNIALADDAKVTAKILDTDTGETAHFVGQSNRFSVIGNALARDEAVYGVGIGYKFNERAMVRAGYDGSYGDKTYSHRGNLSFSLWF